MKFTNFLKKKMIPFLMVFAVILSVFTLSSFAMESAASEGVADSAGEIPSDKEPEKEPAAEAPTEAPTKKNEPAVEDTGEGDSKNAGEAESDNFITSFLMDFEENLPEILSALSLICSVILMFIYKSGFIPMVKEGISALSGKVKAISEEADKIANDGKSTKESVCASLALSEQRLASMESALSALSEKLYGIEKISSDTNTGKAVLSLEVEMLYEIFMSASLPQYVKDRVGEKIAKMRLSIEGGAE